MSIRDMGYYRDVCEIGSDCRGMKSPTEAVTPVRPHGRRTGQSCSCADQRREQYQKARSTQDSVGIS